MNCDEFVELVTGYLEGALDDTDRRRAEEHLGVCDGCSTYLGQVRATIAGLRRLPPERGSTPGRDRLLEAFRRSV
jgi:anti-sigma factor RsiW